MTRQPAPTGWEVRFGPAPHEACVRRVEEGQA